MLLFVRLPQDHEWRKLSPAGIREIILQKLAISPSLSGKIKPVNLGFALSPCSTEARETILNAGNCFFLSGAKLEPATNWIPMIIPTVPKYIRKIQGEIEVGSSMLIDEVERNFVNVAIDITQPKTILGQRHVEIVAQPTTLKTYIWRLPSVEIVQAVLRPRAAEESATAAENINIDLTSSQQTEIDGNIDNIQAFPIENSTGSALRL
ncbi:putative eka-like protein [Erysiphe necator]|uniref:Putative eka-like protein n=1 Tax=Uncinula necator TaxID=52586 RepID=A0A0B1PBK9_UNCNE|nr:putative eka-like protein [Erysiphe necator]